MIEVAIQHNGPFTAVDRNAPSRSFGFHLSTTMACPSDEFIIFDTRSLRGGNKGFIRIIRSVKELILRQKKFKIIFLRGFLGTDLMINKLKEVIAEDKDFKEHIILIDEIIPQKTLIDFYTLSDVFISLLPNDQFGASILDAVFTDCSLIISDLEVYKHYLGEKGPIYISDQNEDELIKGIEAVMENKNMGKVSEKIRKQLMNDFNPDKAFQNIYEFCKRVTREHYEASTN